jgi:hypothetical protein
MSTIREPKKLAMLMLPLPAPTKWSRAGWSINASPVSQWKGALSPYPDPLGEGLTVYSSTQAPHLNRGSLAEVLGMDENLIRVVAPDVGGGFGVKIGMFPEDAAVAVLAACIASR